MKLLYFYCNRVSYHSVETAVPSSSSFTLVHLTPDE